MQVLTESERAEELQEVTNGAERSPQPYYPQWKGTRSARPSEVLCFWRTPFIAPSALLRDRSR